LGKCKDLLEVDGIRDEVILIEVERLLSLFSANLGCNKSIEALFLV
jgi:hypothetical protein